MGLYLHIPFCIRKCNYCDFLSFPADYDHQKAYIHALRKEIALYSGMYHNKYSVDSIFIGGGTPSLLNIGLLRDLTKELISGFDLAKDTEVTIESNPKTLNKEKLEAYLEMGINRLSIGTQSFDNELLSRLGRSHSAEDFFDNYFLARKCGFQNINIDLMFSIPGQTMEHWRETLHTAADLAPEHLSFYSLQIEEGTPFFQMKEEGTLVETDGREDREMYHYTQSFLKEKEYLHYEISNASRAGYQCRHNLKYWSMENYLGLGLGAHSFMNGERFSNETDLKAYIKAGEMVEQPMGKNTSCIVSSPFTVWNHVNSREDDISEYLFTGLRKIEGVDLNEFHARFGESIKEVYAHNWNQIERYIRGKYLVNTGNRLRFTKKGIDISNTILTEFIF